MLCLGEADWFTNAKRRSYCQAKQRDCQRLFVPYFTKTLKHKHLSLLETSPMLFWQLLQSLLQNEYQCRALRCNYCKMMLDALCLLPLTFRHKGTFYQILMTWHLAQENATCLGKRYVTKCVAVHGWWRSGECKVWSDLPAKFHGSALFSCKCKSFVKTESLVILCD